MPELPSVRAVLFDMDGTLVDTEGLWWQAVEEEAAALGYRLGEADVPEVLGRAVEHTAAHLHARSRLPDAAGTSAQRSAHGGPAERQTGERPAGSGGGSSREAIAAGLQARFAALVAEQVRPLPGALPLLDGLAARGVPLGLVSASPRSVVDLVLDVLGRKRFAVSVAEGETPRTKPDPDPYRAAAAALGFAPSQCLAVEDTPTGVASAEAAGCAVLAVPSLTPIPPAPGRAVLRSLTEADPGLLLSLAPADAAADARAGMR